MASEHQPGGTGDQFLAPSGLPRLAKMFLRETQLMGSLKRAFTGVHDRVLVGVESPRCCTSPFSWLSEKSTVLTQAGGFLRRPLRQLLYHSPSLLLSTSQGPLHCPVGVFFFCPIQDHIVVLWETTLLWRHYLLSSLHSAPGLSDSTRHCQRLFLLTESSWRAKCFSSRKPNGMPCMSVARRAARKPNGLHW